ncbi:hypothetical protein NQ317_018413 [Molorchus minor]|uniref:Uncharacterized protein n=1 Tax=Molorchus minor TaxID=1323400 RepID=A0ABQ9JS58_9CUCU|nr:hypothetical protein NQ317_018413 [Molorchus minor]
MSENLRLKRGQIKGRLTRFQTYFNSVKNVELTGVVVTEINLRLSKIEGCLDEFDVVQSDLEILEPNELESNEREQFESSYYQLLSEARQLCTQFENESGNQLDGNSNEGSVHNCRNHFYSQNQVGSNKLIKLPPIKLPNFDGQYQNWLEFKDGFKALVDENSCLNNTQKFYYLRSSLTKEAGGVIITYLEITAENYAVAWSLLEERFANKANDSLSCKIDF